MGGAWLRAKGDFDLDFLRFSHQILVAAMVIFHDLVTLAYSQGRS